MVVEEGGGWTVEVGAQGVEVGVGVGAGGSSSSSGRWGGRSRCRGVAHVYEEESGVVDRACPPVSASLWSRDGRCRRLGKYLLGLPYSRVLRTCDQPGALMEMEKEQVNRNRNEVLGPGSNNDRRRRRRRWRQQQRVGPASTVHSATRDYERPGACEEGPRE